MMKITSVSIFFWKNKPNNFDIGFNLNKTGTMADVQLVPQYIRKNMDIMNMNERLFNITLRHKYK